MGLIGARVDFCMIQDGIGSRAWHVKELKRDARRGSWDDREMLHCWMCWLCMEWQWNVDVDPYRWLVSLLERTEWKSTLH